jgi:hypothetical protein
LYGYVYIVVYNIAGDPVVLSSSGVQGVAIGNVELTFDAYGDLTELMVNNNHFHPSRIVVTR